MQESRTLKPASLLELEELSTSLGGDINLVQGSGGNTSIKYLDQIWVKGSGKKLRDSRIDNIFLPLNLSVILSEINNGNFENSISSLFENYDYQALRPSIETGMHAIIPYKIVIHLHPVNLLGILVREDAEHFLRNIFTVEEYLFLPYIKPGSELTKAIKNSIEIKKLPNILFLGNHGVVVSGENFSDVIKILDKMTKIIPISQSNSTYKYYEQLNNLIEHTMWKLPIYEDVHFLANDKICLSRAISGILFPDHIVFLGPKVLYYKADKLQLKSWLNLPHVKELPYVILPGIGVVTNPNLSQDGHELLLAWCRTLLQIPEKCKINYLKNEQIEAIHNWDAEKYRFQQSIKPQ
jgi:rhamnose utilization protein RhaD (predicted bifunctional aldolase and dehydrogenase)